MYLCYLGLELNLIAVDQSWADIISSRLQYRHFYDSSSTGCVASCLGGGVGKN